MSDHELAFLIRVNVPDSGNYTLAIRPADVYSAASSYYNDGRTLMVEWEVDLNRPETIVLSGPDAVTTEGSAMFEFGCELGGDEPEDGCYYEFQMTAVGSLEDKVDVDWDSVDWLPTVRVMGILVNQKRGRLWVIELPTSIAISCGTERERWDEKYGRGDSF